MVGRWITNSLLYLGKIEEQTKQNKEKEKKKNIPNRISSKEMK